jgi:hypothetical protein
MLQAGASAISNGGVMGDKSPKSKQRNKSQKDAVKAQVKNDKDKRQQSHASVPGKSSKT